jgi:MFS family permease
MLLQIVIADMTSLRWRGLVGGLVSAPFLVNIFVSAEIASRVLPDWRRGYVQFAVVVPLMLAPLIAALLAQRKDRPHRHGLGAALRAAAADMDFVGLVLVAASLALILVPLGIVPAQDNNWEHGTLTGMGLLGVLLFAAFLAYEWHVPAHPVFPMRWLRRTPILSACLIGFFDFTSFYLQYTYLYSFVLVTEDWGLKTVAYFVYTHAFSITVFGIVAGGIMYATRRFKWMLFAGLLVRLLGVGIMLRARSAQGTTLELVLCQVLQGLGGGFAGIATQVGAQAAVGSADIATVTAMTLLLSEVGNSVGSAAATGIWNTYMPRDLAEHVPTTNQTLLDELFGSITDIVEYPIDDPIRLGAIEAYRSVMHRLVVSSCTCHL